MENKRITSDSEFSLYNVLKEFILFFIQCYIGYSLIEYSKFYYNRFVIKIKLYFSSSVISDFLFLLSSIIYSLIIVYLFHITSFYCLREYIFSIWKNLYSTDSNIRDLNSFKIFYCEKNYYNLKLNEISGYNSDNNGNTSDNKLVYEDSIRAICFLNLLDFWYIEYCLILGIIFSQILGNFNLFKNNRVDERIGQRQDDRCDYLKCISEYIDIISNFMLKIFYALLYLFFIYLYYSIYKNYNHNSKSTSQNNQKIGESNSNINEEIEYEVEINGKKNISSPLWSTLEIIVEIINAFA